MVIEDITVVALGKFRVGKPVRVRTPCVPGEPIGHVVVGVSVRRFRSASDIS